MEHEYDITKKVTSGECFREAYSDLKKIIIQRIFVM